MNVPLANAFIGEEEAKAVYDVVKSGWISQGKKVEEFENDFKRTVDAKHAIAVNNGTSALHVCLMALGIGPGDEVILPSLTFISTASVALFQHATPVLAECNPKTYNVTGKDIEKLITKKTKAIIPVDMNGMPIDYDEILEVAEKHSLPVIADSAESLGATYKKKKIGCIAPIHCFSFFPNKNVTTGEGGMVTTEDDELAVKMRKIRSHGQEWRYHHVMLGNNYRMTEMQAALGIVQLRNLDNVLKAKEKIVRRYNEAFADNKHIQTPYVPDYVTRHAWYMYTISVDRKMRDQIVQKLKEHGIDTRLSFPPIHAQPLFKEKFGFHEEYLPITFDAWSKLINIPIGPKMTNEEQDYVINNLVELSR
ncbi:MAG: DegT/DnrJ/EryC1/StrS family aminotransferase [Candidatus Aenigmarchaeota archaeon]|nr:DegT/DnrJ/EryC1/StrS family aminotransferase [Candidatus Aenigmarchaeota archaeon]